MPDAPPVPVAPEVPDVRRARLAEAFEGLDLYRREVGDLSLSPEQRRPVDALFEGVTAWWKPIRAEFDAGRPPPDDRVAALAHRTEETRVRVQAMLGPDRALELAALRRAPRGAGRQWASKLRLAVESVGVTRGQSGGVEAVIATLHAGIDDLPAADPADERVAAEMRQRVQGLIDAARKGLGDVLTPAQMQELVRRVPTLTRPVPGTVQASGLGAYRGRAIKARSWRRL